MASSFAPRCGRRGRYRRAVGEDEFVVKNEASIAGIISQELLAESEEWSKKGRAARSPEGSSADHGVEGGSRAPVSERDRRDRALDSDQEFWLATRMEADRRIDLLLSKHPLARRLPPGGRAFTRRYLMSCSSPGSACWRIPGVSGMAPRIWRWSWQSADAAHAWNITCPLTCVLTWIMAGGVRTALGRGGSPCLFRLYLPYAP